LQELAQRFAAADSVFARECHLAFQTNRLDRIPVRYPVYDQIVVAGQLYIRRNIASQDRTEIDLVDLHLPRFSEIDRIAR